MANSTSIAAVALSLQELLNRSFADLDALDANAFRALPTARIVRTEDFGQVGISPNSVITLPSLSMFCYRVDINHTMRAPWSAVAHHEQTIHLPLDAHFLLTPFDTDAEAELRILGATMQCLERHPIVSGPRLHPSGGWDARDAIQVINEDLVTEDVLRTFDTLPTDFRLSVSYVARVTRIDAPDEPDHPDVVTAVRGLVPSPVPVP
ncbi:MULTISPECIES: DUF4255 domain-containing protein [Rhodococcus]|uniref:DUF4255 domain-containing protein n=1 Tax=Rhodococcus TaxID=1827 RepID=UPI00135AD768|nr:MULTISPECIES: DUF4255 domain-containing protein [Rhodococcus]KAF0956748.1 hypothetical protein MLGJGCBP_10156 [Rhodococcus sp. T7]KAF0966594.1 hypothetical protein MLGJGCBP_00269 [Rhodococcus sp. T7]UOT08356.1 DUF4255 domain-containing protein [Rhodococcus opacus]